jgi:hypothetical protein
MIVSDEYVEWFKNTSDDARKTVFNHVIYTFCSMSLFNRFKIAGEIILGKKFCIWISRDQ